jgi:hypothetical protein
MTTAAAVHEEKDFQTRTNEYAARCIESMKDDLDALHHARECDGKLANGKPCKRGSETKKYKTSDGKTGQQCIHENPEAWHDEDRAREAIEEGHYGIQIRSEWHNPGENGADRDGEYKVTLGGGGPASQIVGELQDGEPYTAIFQFQDLFKPWTDAQTTSDQDDIMLEWVQQLYFGE